MYNAPKFIIPGVPRCGTTSAVVHLSKHPNIHVLSQLNFFNVDKDVPEQNIIGYNNGMDIYNKYFIPGVVDIRGVPINSNKKCLGERTAGYFNSKKAIKRIRKELPDIKLVIFLREPISRSHSQWNKSNSFKHHVDLELNITNTNYFTDSFYFDSLDYIFDIFPRENIHISISEKVIKNPLIEYNKIFNFLGEESIEHLDFDPNINRKIYKNISNDDFFYLYKIIKPYNEKLYHLLGYEIDEWEMMYKKLK